MQKLLVAVTLLISTITYQAKALQQFVDELPKLPTVYGYWNPKAKSGSDRLTMGMFPTKWKFHRDLRPTNVFAYGVSKDKASVPGPIIEARPGKPTHVTWANYLGDTHLFSSTPKGRAIPTVVHLHGGVQDPQIDGHPLAWFTQKFNDTGPAFKTRTYTYNNEPPAGPGNLIYHDFAIGLARVNVLAGLFGAYVVRDPDQETRIFNFLPEFERHLVIFDRSFSGNGESMTVDPTGDRDVIIVNGKAWPFLNVQPRRYRFRITNVSNKRYFRFHLQLPNQNQAPPFIQLGSDSSYLPSPVRTSQILLAPFETADVIIDFANLRNNT
nr:TPA_asm: hypothetical protein HUJ06_007149 [Nelumbo nucifera]